jgi:two-component system chemotaxis response regulator CheB
MLARNIVLIGASAGGVEALLALVRALPADFPAAMLIVLHVPRRGNSALPKLLSRAGSLPAHHVSKREPVQAGQIYVAPPDHHMLLQDGHVCLSRGPQEHGHRPAIDPLFRSAARWYGPHALGVILSGSLDDGTSGMLAIKRHGGVTVVQDPREALYPSMPKSALDNVPIDHIATLSTMGTLLTRLVRESPAASQAHMSRDTEVPDPAHPLETDCAASDDEPEDPGVPSGLACPDCHGVLWELREGELMRFRCRVGHAFLPQSLSAAMSEKLDEALWIALRSLRENAELCVRLSERALHRNMHALAANYRERADEAEQRASVIEQVLRRGQLLVESPELAAGEAPQQ